MRTKETLKRTTEKRHLTNVEFVLPLLSPSMVALVNYREDGVTPFFILWKDGLKVTKI
jgi:hypothetical protein